MFFIRSFAFWVVSLGGFDQIPFFFLHLGSIVANADRYKDNGMSIMRFIFMG